MNVAGVGGCVVPVAARIVVGTRHAFPVVVAAHSGVRWGLEPLHQVGFAGEWH